MKTKLLVLCAAGLLLALTKAPAATFYVDAASTNAVPPFTNWATAAAVIQDAIDSAASGDEVVVTNGVYQTGARAVYGMSNRVAVTKRVTVRSVNGPEVTFIQGFGPIGDTAVRCVYLTNGAVLAGFTLTNGTTQTSEEPEVNPVSTAGGGVWCESQSAVVTNCVLAGNTAFEGGGAYSGTLNSCTLTGNSAIPTWFDSSGGGAYGSALINCTLTGNWADLGGGAYSSTLTNCTLTGNRSPQAGGGGAAGSTLNNCTLIGNTGNEGGGASYCTMNNCTLTDNGSGDGGGAAWSTLNNCTLTGNGGGVGGGVLGCALNNCTLTGNRADALGGGAAGSTLTNCTLRGNWTQNSFSSYSFGGGAYDCTLNSCLVTGNSCRDEFGEGGGASSSILINCTLTSNWAAGGGGASGSTLTNCMVAGNSAGGDGCGGGAVSSTLNNCTLSGNSAPYGGGSCSSTLNNCIAYYNISYTSGDNYFGGAFNYSCTTPNPGSGVGNITNAPLFVGTNGWSNLRLQSNSPCINSGNNAYVTTATDLDGNPRISGGTVDMGAYEFQSPQSTLSYAWLQQSGLPTDGSADHVDTDHDGHDNWQEWMAGTDPTNTLSVLRLVSPVITPTNITLTWTSVTNRTYTLEQATNLGGAPAYSVLCSNLVGLPGTTSWTDTNAPVSSPCFYRLRVSP